LKLAGFNDAIAIVPGDVEGYELPSLFDLVLQMWCAKKK
jgi:hypothetical protein